MRLRRVRMGFGFCALAAVLLVLALGTGRGGTTRTEDPLTGHRAPTLSGTTLQGDRLHWTPGGQVTVVNIWAAWCPTCRKELPMLARIAHTWEQRGVRVVTIDAKDGPGAARSLLREVHATGLVAVQDPRGRRAVAWGATGVPETVVVGRDGVIRGRWLGAVSRQWLTGKLRALTGSTS